MCPACVTSAALLVGGVTTTGGVSALLVKVFRSKKKSTLETLNDETQRRGDHANDNEQNKTGDGSVAR